MTKSVVSRFSVVVLILPVYTPSAIVKDEAYAIRANGIGLFRVANVSYAEVRLLYPNFIISIGRGDPGALWRKKSGAHTDQHYFVFREEDIELFRAECSCTLVSPGDWKPIYLAEADDRTKVILHPTAISPKFRTDKGIGVGSTVSDLRKAYPPLRNLTAVHPPYSTPANDYEFVCFAAHILYAGADSIHTMNFYVRPAPGKLRAGKYVDSDHTTIIDPNATIVGVQPHGGCLLNNVAPD